MSNPANLKQQGLFSKELVNSGSAMAKLNKITGDGSKLIKDKFVRSLAEERKALEDVEKAMQRVTKAYSRRSSALSDAVSAGDMSKAGSIQKGLAKGQDTMLGLQAQKMEIEKTLKAMQDGGLQTRLISVISAVAAGAEVVSQGAALYQRGKTLGEANLAAAYSPAARMSGSLIGGQFNNLAAIADPNSLKSLQNASGTGAYNLGTGAGILGKILAGAGVGAAGGSLFAGLGAIPGAAIGALGGAWSARGNIQDFFMGGGAAKQGQTLSEQMSNLQSANFFRDQLMSDLEGNAAGRLGAMRQLGGRGAMFNTMGAGLGMGTTGDVLGQGAQFAGMVGPGQSADMMKTMFGLQRGQGGFNMSSGASMGLLSGLSMGLGGLPNAQGKGGAKQEAIDIMSTAFASGLRNARVADEIGSTIGTIVSSAPNQISGVNPLTTGLANLPGYMKEMFGREMNMYDARHIPGALKANEAIFGAGGAFGAGRLGLAAGLIGKSSFGKSGVGNYLVSGFGQMSAQDIMTGNMQNIMDMAGPGANKEELSGIFNQFRKGSVQQALGFRFKNAPNNVIDRIMKGEDMATVLNNASGAEKRQTAAFLKTRLNEPGVGLEDVQVLTGILSGTNKSLAGEVSSKDFGGSVEKAYLAQKGIVDIKTASEEGRNKEIQAAIGAGAVVFNNMATIFNSAAEPANKFNTYLEAIVKTMSGVKEADVEKFIHESLTAPERAKALAAKEAKEHVQTKKLTKKIGRIKF
jgi:hypothetical protein